VTVTCFKDFPAGNETDSATISEDSRPPDQELNPGSFEQDTMRSGI